MLYFGVFRIYIFSVLIVGLFCSANDLARLKGRIKLLETRLNSEVFFRDEEYVEITERLDDIDNVIYTTVARGQPVISETTEISYLDNKKVDLLNEDYARIRKAFREEKTETERIRRQIPRIENNLISISEHVENYCKSAFNNTDQILASFEVSCVSEKRILLDVIEKFETVRNNTDDNMMRYKQERLILHDMTENDRKILIKIENLEKLVTDLFLHIEGLFLYGSSCLYLKNIGRTKSGVYKLGHGFEVYCDMVTDGGGWTVFQRRINGEVDFYRNWYEYKNGFGDLDGEFWLGNDHLSLLTAGGIHELRVEIEDFSGNTAYAKYRKFKIYPEGDKYKLEVSGYSGTAGDSLAYHNGMMFSTFDNDNDIYSSVNCADDRHGAWWYKECYYSNLNGQYYNELGNTHINGINWYYWKNSIAYLKSVQMKFR